jgi:PKD repeat protein
MKKMCTLILGMALLFASHSFAQSPRPAANPYIKGEMLVQLKDKASLKALLVRAPEDLKVKLNRELSKPMRIWLLEYDEVNNDASKMQNWLYEQPEVTIADYNYYVSLRATTPGDPLFTQQWHHVNTGANGGTADADIDSDLAWDITTGGTSATNDDIVVCMIESGDLDQVDLAPNRWVNTAEIPNNGVDDDNNGYIDDYNGWNPVSNDDDYGNGGHGTNCLGMIGAKGDNNTLVVGANWDVKLMVVGDYNANSQANVIEAYTYPLIMRQRWNNSNGTEGAFVVATSASWGLDNTQASTAPLWCQFYDTLGVYGILNVGATTNNNTNVDVDGDVPTQCSSPYMVGVGRTDRNDQWEGGYGVTTIDFGAPGVDVLTTAVGNGTTVTTGTSFSCPLTAGVIGLAYSIPCADFMTIVKNDPQAGADLVLNALLKGVDVKANLANRYITSGRLNAKNTLDTLMAVACSGDLCLAPSGGAANVTSDNTASLTFNPYASATATTLYWRAVGAPTWTQVDNPSSPVNLTGLIECSEYEFYMNSTCNAETSSNSSIVTFTTTGCGACIEGAYCTSEATNPADEWIAEFTINGYTNTSGDDNGYGNFTASSSIDLEKDQAYNFSSTVDWDGTAYDEQTRIWIDLNHDGDFEASEMLFDQGTADQTVVVNGSITIPLSATSGNTRMRVQLAYIGNSQPDLPDVCGNFTWGEVEDYCVNILSPSNCGITVDSSFTNVTCNGASTGTMAVSNVAGGTPGYTYTWSNGLGSNTSVSNVAAGGYSVTISDNAGCDTTVNFVLTEGGAINATSSFTNPDCNNASTGSMTIDNVTGGNSSYTYSWSNGLGTDQDQANVASGNYTLTITDGEGCTGTESFTLTNPPVHTAAYNFTPTDLSVVFANVSLGGGTYVWDFGDGNTSTDENPTHVYASANTYEVCLEHTTACGTYDYCENIVVNTQGIYEELKSTINVYPNPARDVINFEISNDLVTSIEIVDLVGKVVYAQNITSDITTLLVSQFSQGQYLYKLKDSKGATLLVDKMIVSK